ncbi:MAG: hypothetical protein V1816_05575 [Pseudomonadota bacterium]
MNKKEELILKAAKEIIVKFIETGRVYPGSFEENYKLVSRVVREAIRDEDQGE